jgi:hypothetical protein
MADRERLTKEESELADLFNKESQGTMGRMLEVYSLRTGDRRSSNMPPTDLWVDQLREGYDNDRKTRQFNRSKERDKRFDIDRVPNLDEIDPSVTITNADGSFNSEGVELNNAHHITRYEEDRIAAYERAGALSNPYLQEERETEYSDHTDTYDEMDARLREERGEFEGFYSLKNTVDTQALAETNNFRGQSGNNKAMYDFLKSQTMSKVGGPKPFDVTKTDDWYAYVESYFDAVDKHIDQAESTGISQGGSRAVAWLGRTFIGEPLRALRELQDADLTRTPSDSPTGTETIQKVVNNAANVGVLSSAVPVPAGALRLFGGKEAAQNLTAQGFPHAESALAIAKKMKTAGKSEEEIRKATNDIMEEAGLGGISIGADGKLRFEVSDKYSRVKHWEAMKSGEEYNLGMIFEHPTLYKMFPDIGLDVTVSVNKVNEGMRNFKPSASYQPDQRHIKINARNEEEARSALLHELQHEIQFQERFSFGGNVDMMRGSVAEDEIRKGMRGLDLRERIAKYGSSDPAHAAYSRLEGEVEAKNVQTRADYSARERRAQKPEDTEAFPRDQQINEGHLQLDEVPPGLRTAYSKGDVDLASDVAPRDWAPHTGMNKHLKKDYVLIDNQTGEPVGSAATKQGADRSAGKRGGREDEASTIRVEKTQDFLNRKWNGPEMKRWRETQLERARERTQEMAFDGKKMSAKDIGDNERRIARSLKTNTVSKEKLERDLKTPERFSATRQEQMRHGIAQYQTRIDQLNGELAELTKIKEARAIMPKNTEFSIPAAATLDQAAPKTMSPDAGPMGKRRSKLERLKEQEESLITIAEGEPRIARVQQAKKRLEATRRQIKELTGE